MRALLIIWIHPGDLVGSAQTERDLRISLENQAIWTESHRPEIIPSHGLTFCIMIKAWLIQERLAVHLSAEQAMLTVLLLEDPDLLTERAAVPA